MVCQGCGAPHECVRRASGTRVPWFVRPNHYGREGLVPLTSDGLGWERLFVPFSYSLEWPLRQALSAALVTAAILVGLSWDLAGPCVIRETTRG